MPKITYTCNNPNHPHSGLKSLHQIEDGAFALGLDTTLTDRREAQRVADIVIADLNLPPVQLAVADIKPLGRYQPAGTRRRVAQIQLNARLGSYKTLAHEIAHHAVKCWDWAERNAQAARGGKVGKRILSHGKEFKTRFREMNPLVAKAAGLDGGGAAKAYKSRIPAGTWTPKPSKPTGTRCKGCQVFKPYADLNATGVCGGCLKAAGLIRISYSSHLRVGR